VFDHPVDPDFSRQVVCVLGLPFDAVNLGQAAQRVRAAARDQEPLLVSTVNINFVVNARRDAAFGRSILHSQLSLADGMPIVWISRLLGLPIGERVPGSDLFERLRRECTNEPLRVYFFGGQKGVAQAAASAVNAQPAGICCVGFDDPGFGSIERLSTPERIQKINDAAPDFLIVSLGAQKGPHWIEKNRLALKVPVISHLGAVIGFAAGDVRRAPRWLQRMGLEWLWRIKEEPSLWQRYAGDGVQLLRLLCLSVLPLYWARLREARRAPQASSLPPRVEPTEQGYRLRLQGRCDADSREDLTKCLREVAAARKNVQVDVKNLKWIDAVAMGQLLLLYGHQCDIGCSLRFSGVSPEIRRLFRYHCAEYLLIGQERPRAQTWSPSLAPGFRNSTMPVGM
jgi:N-acetylglucosaminyldiphosphoundecaprenol N-acetyl-beta-D-mannosaminyltransferase